MDFLKPSEWEQKKRPDIFLPGSSAVTDYVLSREKEPMDTFPGYAEDTSAYRFLQGTPLSFFHSSSSVPETGKAPEETEAPKKTLPEGSEAAAGQFLIQFEAHYGQQVAGMEYQKGTRLGNALFLLDALIRYHTVFPWQQEPSLVTLLLLSVRRQKGWEKDALSRLRLLGVWLSRHETECLLPLPVLLVEDIAMAVSLYAKMHGREVLLGLTVYFCPDSLLMAYPPLQALYRCEVAEDGKVTAVRVRLENS